MAAKSSDFRSSPDAFADHELVLGPPSDAIPRLLSALGYCFEHLIAESRILADTHIFQRQDTLASARSASVLSDSVPDEKRSLLDVPAEPDQFLKAGLPTKNKIVNSALSASVPEEERRFLDVPAEPEQLLKSGLPTQNKIDNLDGADDLELKYEANDEVPQDILDTRCRQTEPCVIDDIYFQHPEAVSQDESAAHASPENFRDVHREPAKPKLDLKTRLTTNDTLVSPEDADALEMKHIRHSGLMTIMGSRSSAASMCSLSSNIGVMPKWYNRDADSGGASVDPEIFSRSTRYWCILEPAGTVRLTWDCCWCMLLMFEIWATPIRLVFVGDGNIPQWWEVTLFVSFSFFCTDIVLNFFTGFVEDDVDIMDQRRIVRNYLKYWFLFDVAATIPWNWLVGEEHGTELSSTSATKSLKVIRMMKLVRAAKLVRIVISYKKVRRRMSTSNVERRRKKRRMKRNVVLWKTVQAMSSVVSQVVTSATTQAVAPALVIIAVLAHFHAIIWAALQDDWSTTSDMSMVFHRYLESLWWAISSLMFGNTSVATKPELWLLDIFVLFEKLILCTWMARRVVVVAIMTGDDESQMKCREALKYMEEHDITLKTELQILKYWNDLSKKRKRQRCFLDLVKISLPLELQRRINQEMWSDKLRSLGLIQHLYELSVDFVFQLSQLVNEDAYASSMIVCKEGDPAKAAYHINSGELTVLSADQSILPFQAGMWIGEKALVNPDLRRYGSVVAKATSTLLTVPAPAFFQLLIDLGIDQQFKKFCESELWKGLCGRCGQVGDHWAHECPLYFRKTVPMLKIKTISSAGSKESIMTRSTPATKSDLSLFLGHHKLDHIEEWFEGMGIYNLDDLEEGIQYVQEELGKGMRALNLSTAQIEVFSAERVRKFRRTMAAQTSFMMKACTSLKSDHYMFLSHYKVEAGTEAALMRAELESLIQEDNLHPAFDWKTPVYLDSEDLTDLHVLMDEVSSSHNLVLMLTKGVLTRPWCLLEIATAARDKVPVLPVNILKSGCEFTFPDGNFYKDLRSNIGSSGVDLIEEHGFLIDDVVNALKEIFKRIAVPYSPHRPASIRKVELQELMKQATVRDGQETDSVGFDRSFANRRTKNH